MYLTGFCFILLFTIALVAGGKSGGKKYLYNNKQPSSSNTLAPIPETTVAAPPANPALIRFQVTKHGPRVEGDKKVLEEDKCFCSGVVINAAARIALTSKICAEALQWRKHHKSEFNAVSAGGDTFSVVGYVEFGNETAPVEPAPVKPASSKKKKKKSQAESSGSGATKSGVDDLAFVILGDAHSQIPLPNEPDLQVEKAFLGQWNYDQNLRTWNAIEHEIDSHTIVDSWGLPAFKVFESDYVGDEPPVSFCRYGSPLYTSTSAGTRLSGIYADLDMFFINVRKYSAQITIKMQEIVSNPKKIIPF